jgi:hypothetical protein
MNDQQAVVWQRVILLAGLAVVLFGIGLSLVPFTPPLAVTATGRPTETGCSPAVVSIFDDDAPAIPRDQQAIFGGPVLACRDEARRRLAKTGVIVVLAAVGIVAGTRLVGGRARLASTPAREPVS